MDFFNKKKLASSLEIPQFVKVGMKIINFISSKLAVLLAAKLFTTPIKFKAPSREKAMLNGSQIHELYVDSIQKEIEILSYGYSDKKVLLVHGWAGRSTQLFMIAHKLLEKGYMVISFDGPSHGNSSGKSTNLLEFIETVKKIHEKYGPFEAGIGHSFGGMTLLNVQSQENYFKKIVTIGSANKVSNIIKNFSFNLGLNQKFYEKLHSYFEKNWNLRLDDYASEVAASKIKIPVLVTHDVMDGDVPVRCALEIRQHLQNGTILVTQDLGHTKILRTPKIADSIVNFILDK